MATGLAGSRWGLSHTPEGCRRPALGRATLALVADAAPAQDDGSWGAGLGALGGNGGALRVELGASWAPAAVVGKLSAEGAEQHH